MSCNCAARRPWLPLLLYSLDTPWSTARSKTKCCHTACGKVSESLFISPMASGLLTGAMTRDRAAKLPKDDWRSNHPDFTEPNLSRNLALVGRLREIARRRNRSAGEVAIAWTLHHPAVTGAIVGARDARQAEGVMLAGELYLTNEEVNEIETFVADNAA
jgi:aryl-alcohol dehydrogenase-like predicted oxidoreductase